MQAEQVSFIAAGTKRECSGWVVKDKVGMLTKELSLPGQIFACTLILGRPLAVVYLPFLVGNKLHSMNWVLCTWLREAFYGPGCGGNTGKCHTQWNTNLV